MRKKNKKYVRSGEVGLWVVSIFMLALLILTIILGYVLFIKPSNDSAGKNAPIPVSFPEKKLIYSESIKDSPEVALNGAHEFWQKRNYLFITSAIDHGLEIMNIADPANPKHVGSFIDNETTLMRKPHSVSVSDNYAFVGSMEDGAIQVLDISNPATPAPVSFLADTNEMGLKGMHGTSIYKGYLYVAGTGENALTILDISDPKALKHVKTIFDDDALSLKAPHSAVFKNDYAYVIAAKEGIQILNIANPADPKPVSAFKQDSHGHTLDGGHDVYIFGNYLVTASYAAGLNFFDISDPEKLIEVAEIRATKENGLESVADLDVAGNFLFAVSEVGSALVMVDITDPKNPQIIDVLRDDGTGEMFLWNGHYVHVIGNYVYVAGLQNGFGIVKYNK